MIVRYVALVAFVVAAVFAVAATSARAQPVYTNVCPDMPPDLVSATDAAIEVRELGQRAVTICLTETERLERLIALYESAVEDEATTAAQRVALSPVDRNRLDLQWWGTWAVAGLMLGLFGGHLILRAFRFWRE